MEKNKYSKNLNKYEQLYFLIEDYAKEYSKFLEDKDNRTNENRCERYYKKVYDFVKQELDRAREEGRKELIKEIRESIKGNIKIDDTEHKHIKIDTDIVKILDDKEITKMFLDGEEGDDVDWDCYGGWGWYS